MNTPIVKSGTFPAQEIKTCIREALANEKQSQAVLRRQPGSSCDPEIDSLVVIEVMCAIEELIGVSLPTKFAPRGGYRDAQSCVADLLEQTRSVWTEVVNKLEKEHA